jgi:hypothetical protein
MPPTRRRAGSTRPNKLGTGVPPGGSGRWARQGSGLRPAARRPRLRCAPDSGRLVQRPSAWAPVAPPPPWLLRRRDYAAAERPGGGGAAPRLFPPSPRNSFFKQGTAVRFLPLSLGAVWRGEHLARVRPSASSGLTAAAAARPLISRRPSTLSLSLSQPGLDSAFPGRRPLLTGRPPPSLPLSLGAVYQRATLTPTATERPPPAACPLDVVVWEVLGNGRVSPTRETRSGANINSEK